MILTIGNVKGGVGKTTLAVNFAIARALQGWDVLLIDGEEQGTALTFTALRHEQTGHSDYTAVALTGAAVRTQTRQLAPKYHDVIIDVGGRDTGSFRAGHRQLPGGPHRDRSAVDPNSASHLRCVGDGPSL
jgi:chromosome partitioning protein